MNRPTDPQNSTGMVHSAAFHQCVPVAKMPNSDCPIRSGRLFACQASQPKCIASHAEPFSAAAGAFRNSPICTTSQTRSELPRIGSASRSQRRTDTARSRLSGRSAGVPDTAAASTKPLSTKKTCTAQSGLQNRMNGVRANPVEAARVPSMAFPLSSAGWNESTRWQDTTASAATPRRPSRCG